MLRKAAVKRVLDSFQRVGEICLVDVTAAVLTFAAHSTTLDKLRRIPTHTWINLAIFLVGVFVIVKLWRALRSLNDYAPYLACAVAASGVFFYWVYTRTEPEFLTPVVERLTPFFPTQAVHQETIDKVRRNRES